MTLELCSSYLTTASYFVQFAWSVYFLYWLLESAWNYSAPVTSALFFSCEVIGFISNTLFLFTGTLVGSSKNAEDSQTGELKSSIEVSCSSVSKNSDNAESNLEGINDPCDIDDLEIFIDNLNAKRADVAICLCRYNEPLEELLPSLSAMLEIEWAAESKHIYILDDGFYYLSDEEKIRVMKKIVDVVADANSVSDNWLSHVKVNEEDSLCRDDCAVTFLTWDVRHLDVAGEKCQVTLVAREKPPTSHFKAGNVNNFLYNYCATSLTNGGPLHDYMLLLDHDMLASPHIIEEALAAFHDDTEEALAFVQFPQRFYDLASFDRFYAGNEIFFDGIQMNRSEVGLAAFAGTNAVWRMSALYHIGGVQYGSLTEDAHTGNAAHRAGYKSLYIPVDVGIGQSPQSVAAAMKQRMRWSQGAIEMALLPTRKEIKLPICPPVIKSAYKMPDLRKHSIWQCVVIKIINFDSMIYPVYSVGYLLHVVTCVLYLSNAKAPMAPSNSVEILIVWLPLYILKAIHQLATFRRVSLNAHICAQKAWAGYALATLVSIKHAFGSGSTKSWFNTGGANVGLKSYFFIQWGNAMILLILLIAMIVRIGLFTAVEETCQAWDTIGALTYGVIMIYYIQGWAIEPFREIMYQPRNNAMEKDNTYKTQEVDNDSMSVRREGIFASVVTMRVHMNMSSRSLYSSKDISQKYESEEVYGDTSEDDKSADSEGNHRKPLELIQKAIENRDLREKYGFNASTILNILSILVITSFLFIWSKNHCDTNTNIPIKEESITATSLRSPPLPSSFSFDADFEGSFGKLTLNGEPFLLKGINWFGFETDRNMAFGLNLVSQDSVFEFLVKNGVNSIRLPLTVDGINNPSDNLYPSWAVNQNLNPQYAETKDYLQSVESFVRRASQWGIFVLLDMHLLRADTAPDPLPFDQRTPFDDVIAAWETLSERMCDVWSVMGADLKNEPYGATWHVWREAAEAMAGVITERCPSWLIFVEGIFEFDSPKNPLKNEHLGPWGSMLLPAKEDPIRIANKKKLIYSPHVYGPGVVGGENFMWSPNRPTDVCRPEYPFDDCEELNRISFPNNLPATYEIWFGFLQSELNNTLVIGEWGGTYINEPKIENDKGFIQDAEASWNEALVDFMVERNIGSFYWSVNPESIDTGGLLMDDWSTPDTARLSLMRRLPSTSTLDVILSGTHKSRLRRCFESHELEFLVAETSGPRYADESNGYNTDFDGIYHPTAIVFPRGENEVSHAVRCAHDNDVKVCVRSGGYSYTGDSLCDGVLVDVRHLKMVTKVEEESSSSSSFQVGTGNSMGELASELHKHGRFTLGGTHQGVGAGWFLGCGRGWLSRSVGLGCDFVTSARVVTNDGTIVKATDDNEHKDLLWALRGAGSGNFGVVTSFEIETLPLPNKKSFVSFRLHWPRDKAHLVYRLWQDLALDHANPRFTCNFRLWSPAVSDVELEGVLWGAEEELKRILKGAIDVLGEPESQTVEAFDYMEFTAHSVGVENALQIRDRQSGRSGKRRAFRNKSHMIYDRLDAEGIETFLLHANENVTGSEGHNHYIEITPLGGNINSVTQLPSAFPHRSAIAVAQYFGSWTEKSAKPSMLSHQRRFRASMEPFWGNSAFVNYKDNELNDWKEAYWGDSDAVERLIDIKCKYDQSNIFSTMRQSIVC